MWDMLKKMRKRENITLSPGKDSYLEGDKVLVKTVTWREEKT